MTRIYDAFDKFSIVDIVFGFIFGLYLAVFHDDPDLWIFAVAVVLIFCIIMTLIPIAVVIHAKIKYSEKISIRGLIEAFILNVGMTSVSLAFGFVIGSFLVGNFVNDEGKLPEYFKLIKLSI